MAKEGRKDLEQESIRWKTMEGTDGGLHPAVAGQILEEEDTYADQCIGNARWDLPLDLCTMVCWASWYS